MKGAPGAEAGQPGPRGRLLTRWEPATTNAFAGLVLDVHVVMGLSPVHPYKYHLAPSLVERHHHRARGPKQPPNGPELGARHPTSRQRDLTTSRGTI